MKKIELHRGLETQKLLLNFAKIANIDFDKLTIKNCELFEILNKLYFYRKKPKKAYLALAYYIAITTINFIAIQEL